MNDKDLCDICPEEAVWLHKTEEARRCRRHGPLNTEKWLFSLNGWYLLDCGIHEHAPEKRYEYE